MRKMYRKIREVIRMDKFKKLVAAAPVNLVGWAREELKEYADEVIFYPDPPKDGEDLAGRIKDADGVLVGFATQMGEEILRQAPKLKYVGMICSLYSEESANVDIAFARTRGITVKGVRNYGDKGVAEYAVYQLIRILHGYGFPLKDGKMREITGLKVGMVGIGDSGGLIADALHFFGAEVSYFARSVKPEREQQGIHYKPLPKLLCDSEVVFTCLNKNTILLHEEEFQAFGNGKIMFNTSIGPAADMEALENWIRQPGNLFCCDMTEALGDMSGEVRSLENVICMGASSGMTAQAYELLSRKSLDHIREYLGAEQAKREGCVKHIL